MKIQNISIWLSGIAILIAAVSICLNISKDVVLNESIVFFFIGVLATFIVISNYAQVNDIRNSTTNSLNNISEKIKDFERLNTKFSDLEKKTHYNSGETNRIIGNITREKEWYKISTSYYFDAIDNYLLSENLNKIATILAALKENLLESNWSNQKDKTIIADTKLQSYINIINKLDESYTDKTEILNTLNKLITK